MAQLDETHPTIQYFAINVPEAVYKKMAYIIQDYSQCKSHAAHM